MSGKSPSSPPIAVRCCQITGFCLASRVRRVLMPLISCNCLACRVRAHICKQSTGAGSDQSTAMARSALKVSLIGLSDGSHCSHSIQHIHQVELIGKRYSVAFSSLLSISSNARMQPLQHTGRFNCLVARYQRYKCSISALRR